MISVCEQAMPGPADAGHSPATQQKDIAVDAVALISKGRQEKALLRSSLLVQVCHSKDAKHVRQCHSENNLITVILIITDRPPLGRD